MKNDGRERNRDHNGLREIMWDTITDVRDGKIDIKKAAVIIKAGDTIVKSFMAEVAHENMKLELERRRGKVLQLGDKRGGEEGKEEGGHDEVASDPQGEAAEPTLQ